MTAEVQVAGEQLLLRADRSLFWIRTATLVIADPHFGKPDTFRAAGVPLPGGPEETLARLTEAIRTTQARRLVVLGDFWHDRTGVTEALLAALEAWRTAHAGLQIDLVRGNHDRSAPPSGWGSWMETLVEPPFVLTHIPAIPETGYGLAGHIHPGVRLTGRGRERLDLPCFRFGERCGLVPAFGGFTGLASTPPRPGERVFAIADGQVIDVSCG